MALLSILAWCLGMLQRSGYLGLDKGCTAFPTWHARTLGELMIRKGHGETGKGEIHKNGTEISRERDSKASKMAKDMLNSLAITKRAARRRSLCILIFINSGTSLLLKP